MVFLEMVTSRQTHQHGAAMGAQEDAVPASSLGGEGGLGDLGGLAREAGDRVVAAVAAAEAHRQTAARVLGPKPLDVSKKTDDVRLDIDSAVLVPPSKQGFVTYFFSFECFKALSTLVILFTISLGFIYYLIARLPNIEGLQARAEARGWATAELEDLTLKLPTNFEELRLLKKTLDLYQKNYSGMVVLIIIAVYVFLQTFMIPGSIFLNVLAGALYSLPFAIILVNMLGTLGSILCYALSTFFLHDLVSSICHDKLMSFAGEVQKQREHLTNYVLFLRATPILPGWFINAGAPLVKIPFKDFVIGTFIGLLPNVCLTVKAGETLSEVHTMTDLYDAKTVLTLVGCGALAIAPVVYKRVSSRVKSGHGT